MEKSKKLTIDDITKAQNLQVEFLGLLDQRIGDARKWIVELDVEQGDSEQRPEIMVMVANAKQSFKDSDFYCRGLMADWVSDDYDGEFSASLPNMRRKLEAFLDWKFPKPKQ